MLARYRPISTPNPFSLFDSFFSDLEPFFGGSPFGRFHSGPRFEVKKADAGVELSADVPGLTAENLEITAHDGVLTIKGRRAVESPEGYKARRTERGAFSFERSFELSDRIDPESIKASLTDGVLTLSLENRPEAKPRQIAIQSA